MFSTKTTRLAAALATALALTAALPAMARPGPDGGMGHHQPPSAAEVASHLDTMKAALKLTTPAQQTAWKAFEDLAKRHAAAHEAEQKAWLERLKKSPAPNAQEREARNDKLMAQHELDMAEHKKAHDALFATLTAEQGRTLQQQMHAMHGGHHGMPMGMGKGMGMMGMGRGASAGGDPHQGMDHGDGPMRPAPGASKPAM